MPDGDPEYPSQTEVFSSAVLKLQTKDSPEDWMTENVAHNIEGNFLAAYSPTLTASSNRDGSSAKLACDGHHITRWVSASEDKTPWIQIDLGRGARADTLQLAQANSKLSERGYFGAIQELEVSINGGKPITTNWGIDEMSQLRIDLGRVQRVRKIRLTITAFTQGTSVGFSEVELFRM
jgi:hypothetical protein